MSIDPNEPRKTRQKTNQPVALYTKGKKRKKPCHWPGIFAHRDRRQPAFFGRGIPPTANPPKVKNLSRRRTA
jgi:hypothetical protein